MYTSSTVFSEAAIYCGTYGKYNNGSLAGDWLRLADYSDREEFLQACSELHQDEPDPEFMFQDWEYIPEGLCNECGISEKFWELRDALERNGCSDEAAFLSWLSYRGADLSESDPELIVQEFTDKFFGEYDSERDFAEWHLQESGLEEALPEFALRYFDFDAYARDLFADGFSYIDGYVFSDY